MPTTLAARSTEATWQRCRQGCTTPKTEEQLWAEYKATRSIRLRNQIVVANDGLAMEVAHRWKNLCPVPFDELLQNARIGLIKAVERYDQSAAAFSSLAMPYIHGEIQHFLRDYSWDMGKVPRRAIETNSKVGRVQRRWVAMGREVSKSKVARSLGIDDDRWQQTAELTTRKPVLDLDDAVGVASNPEDEDGEALRAELRREIARLPNPYRTAIVERYFQNLSEEAIAKLHNISAVQAQLWLEEGLRRLKSGQLTSRRIG